MAEMGSSVQSLPVNQNTGSIAKNAINPAFLLILALLCRMAETGSVTQLSPVNQNAEPIAKTAINSAFSLILKSYPGYSALCFMYSSTYFRFPCCNVTTSVSPALITVSPDGTIARGPL